MRKLIAAAVLAASTLAPMAIWSEMSGASSRYDDTCGTSRSRELEVVGLTGRRLVCFEAERPDRARDIGRIRGLQVDTRLVGIDFRPATGDLLNRLNELLKFLIPQYVSEGKSYLTIAIGCTGGRGL